jgi:hypothetical protein
VGNTHSKSTINSNRLDKGTRAGTPITGASVPVSKTEVQKIFAGSINSDGVLTVGFTRSRDSDLGRFAHPVLLAATLLGALPSPKAHRPE